MKRFFDFSFCLLAFIFILPIFLFFYILVRYKFGKPAIFVQERPGLNSKLFNLFKFRTMRDLRDSNGYLLPDEERITPFGTFLRSTSIDEIPGLINVIKGDMSLVGPRPLLTEYLPLYSKRQSLRHLVRPGITGWAQINGRNQITWEEKFELDLWYVENQNFLLDLKILFLTLKKVYLREGVSADNHVTVEPFRGNDK